MESNLTLCSSFSLVISSRSWAELRIIIKKRAINMLILVILPVLLALSFPLAEKPAHFLVFFHVIDSLEMLHTEVRLCDLC